MIVVDADCIASPDLCATVARELADPEVQAVQARYDVSNPDASPTAALRAAGFVLKHVIRARGRTHLGLSCGLFGSAMAFRVSVLDDVRWPASVTEDTELHLMLVQRGIVVRFAEAAGVTSPMPTTAEAAVQQQTRWESGNAQLAGRLYLMRLLARGVGTRDVQLLAAGGELLVPSQSMVAAGSLAVVTVAAVARRAGSSCWRRRRWPARPSTSSADWEMLHNLGYQQADVLGVSWGGGLAQQFALLNPRLCRRLILVATATGPQTMVPPNPLPPVKNLRILRRWGDLWGGSARTEPDGLTSALRQARISPLSIGFLYQNTAALGFTTLPLLPLIRQRTLVLTGDDDPIIPVANGRILAAGIPHATLHVYHGGHVELATRPSLLTPLITSFLAAPPHDARRAEQAQTGRHPEHQGPRQVADGTAAAQAVQATAGASALAEALQAARAAQQAAETAAPGRRRAPRRPRAGRGRPGRRP